MTDKNLYHHLNRAFDTFASKPSGEVFLDMQRSGLIDSEGQVQQWDAALAIVSTNATETQRATHFRCRIPCLGLPGRAEIDVSRKNLIDDLTSGKRIITAIVDEETGALREGAEVHLTKHRAIRSDRNEIDEDNLGDLPRFQHVKSWM